LRIAIRPRRASPTGQLFRGPVQLWLRSEHRALQQCPLRRIAAWRPNYCRLGGGNRRQRWFIAGLQSGEIGSCTMRSIIALHSGASLLCIPLHPFPAAQNPGYEHVGQALRFCLSDLVIMKDVPARTCTARELGLDPQTWRPAGGARARARADLSPRWLDPQST
jgi:hypothetical protein